MKYDELVEVYDEIGKTSKRLTKTFYVSELIKKASVDDIQMICYLLQGRVFPRTSEEKIGVAVKLAERAIALAYGVELKTVVSEYRKKGDLGKAAEEICKKKQQRTLTSETLTVKKVFDTIKKLPEIGGAGSTDRKLKSIANLLGSATPTEAKYIIKTVLETLRLGIGEGVLRDSLVWAYFSKEVDLDYDEKTGKVKYNDEYKDHVKLVQDVYDLANDFGRVASELKKGGKKAIKKTGMTIGNPIKVMLAQKEASITEAMDRVGRPCAIEYKYDGFRIQIHVKGKDVILFTRRLDNVSKQFPDIVKYVKESVKCKDCILDTEVCGYDKKTGRYKPFQSISQRIKRKHDIEKLEKELPVEVNVFDVVEYNGKNMLHESFEKRRAILKKIVTQKKKKFALAEQIITKSEKEAEKFYKESLKAGNEGVMFKNLESPYKPGSRVGYMVKFKPVMKELDLVIVEAEWGTGKRAGWLTSFTVACRKGKQFLEIGKVSTGLKEKSSEGLSFKNMTDLLKPLIKKKKEEKLKLRLMLL